MPSLAVYALNGLGLHTAGDNTKYINISTGMMNFWKCKEMISDKGEGSKD